MHRAHRHYQLTHVITFTDVIDAHTSNTHAHCSDVRYAILYDSALPTSLSMLVS